MAFISRECRSQIFGEEGTETLKSSTILAIVYRLEGFWKEAKKLEVQVMEISKTKLSVDHPDTLISMANLASIYTKQGRDKQDQAWQGLSRYISKHSQPRIDIMEQGPVGES
ncbi:hypothetical protein N7470_008726 [Penicillium chermesinum]|nr:hypothetical protein N7470_008726 [Penicillium chermesinum]